MNLDTTLTTGPETAPPPFEYSGNPELREPIVAALRRVIDPEIGLPLVDLGVIYGVTVADGEVRVRMTTTSAACPMTDLMLEDIHAELERVVPADYTIDIELCWDPPWTPDRMSEAARAKFGW